MLSVQVERLDHLGIVASVCQEIGLATYLDGLAGPSDRQVSIGTATTAMILNGLGFSNRRLYLVSQFFATKPVEHLLGPGITAVMLNDDCLGRTLDWLHAHDPTALDQQLKQRPAWLGVQATLVPHPKQYRPGRPRLGAAPKRTEWEIQATLSVDEAKITYAIQRGAAFLVATNVLDPDLLSDQELIQTYKDQHSVERGFAFLKDPLFLASSVFVKKPERIVALSLVMVLCLLVYRLAEQRLREQLAATRQTVPNQLKQPTDRPTMRWIFQCFEGVSLVTFQSPQGLPQHELANLEFLHEQVTTLLGPYCQKLYKISE